MKITEKELRKAMYEAMINTDNHEQTDGICAAAIEFLKKKGIKIEEEEE